MPLRLTKHHGLGNDFLVVADPDGSRSVDADLARAVCDRHRGVGADGLLHLGPGRDGAEISMVLLNADGSRAEMSGNGIGCLAQASVLRGMAHGPRIEVATDAGRRSVEVVGGDGPRDHVVTVAMGKADVADADEPEWVAGDVLRAIRVSVGNPHLVLQASSVEALDDRNWVAALGERANAAIPGGVNVEVVAADGDELRMDVYERGVGLTLACGTGACAAAAAAQRWELIGDRATVRMPGGPTSIELGDGEVLMRTPITYVASVEYLR